MTGAPCRGCGVATTGPTVTKVPRPDVPHQTYEVGTCAACLTLDFDRPGAGVRAALRLLAKLETEDALAAGVFHDAGLDVSRLLYENRFVSTAQKKCWEHVTREERANLRRAYVGVLDARVHAAVDRDRPLPLTPPPPGSAACMACGVGESDGWGDVRTRMLTRGPEYVDGHLCSVCSAVVMSIGALGQSFLEKAVMEAQGLTWAETTQIPGLKAWAATGRPPGKPWEWVKVTEAPPQMDPLVALQAQVADLAAEVEALRATS